MKKFDKDIHLWLSSEVYNEVNSLCNEHLGGMAVSAFVRSAITDKLANEKHRISKMGLER